MQYYVGQITTTITAFEGGVRLKTRNCRSFDSANYPLLQSAQVAAYPAQSVVSFFLRGAVG
jgi:hypothetical protein